MENEIEKGLYTNEELTEKRRDITNQIRSNPNDIKLLEYFISELERSKVGGLITEIEQLDQLGEFLSDLIVLAKSAHNAYLENRVRELENQYFPEDQKAVA